MDEQGKSLDEKITQAILDVTLYFKWSPSEIGGLFWPKEDYTGLLYWWLIVQKMCRAISALFP